MRRLPVLLLLVTSPLHAQRTAARAPFDLPLYGAAAPGAVRSARAEFTEPLSDDGIVRMTHVRDPDVRVFLPTKAQATGAAIVIMPGGGYGMLAIDHEGYQVARWLNTIGVAAIVCKYRVTQKEPGAYPFPVPLLDARQAMRLVRSNAAAWQIDPKRIGVMGFSAGGHLASMVATMAADRISGDDSTALATTPHSADFSVLVYPVISLHEPFSHRGSADNLLGAAATDSARQALSTERRVSPRTPPTFLVATADDAAVPPDNAIAFYQAMLRHTVPGELHVWERGGHGFGMLADRPPVAAEWLPKLRDWMRGRGLLTRSR